MKLKLKIVANASKSEVVGWLGDRLKLRIAAPPEKGKANAAIEKFIASMLGLTSQSVKVIAGHTNAQKTAEIKHASEHELIAAGLQQAQ